MFKFLFQKIKHLKRDLLSRYFLLRYFKVLSLIRRTWIQDYDPSISCIIFSKDRAIQLYALLRSFERTKIGECKVIVIIKADSDIQIKSYQQVEDYFDENVKFIYQTDHQSFQSSLAFALARVNSSKLFFLVDDIIFTETTDYHYLSKIDLMNCIPSLRLGLNISYCYTSSHSQSPPSRSISNNKFVTWKWKAGEFDWNYPLSVDGNIFYTNEVRIWVKYLTFSSPNTFENIIQRFNYIYLQKIGICFHKSRLFNLPVNCVQHDFKNRHGSFDTDFLLDKWFSNKCIDIDKFMGYMNSSPHEEMDLEFVERN